jgi:hypothetical protein
MDRIAGLPNLQGVYDAGVTPPHITLDGVNPLTIVEPSATSGGVVDVQTLARGDGVAGAVGDGAGQSLQIANSAGALTQAFRVATRWSDATAGSEDSEVDFYTRVAGLDVAGMTFRANGVDTQITSPFAFILSPNAQTTDGLRISVSSGNTFVIPQQVANEFYLGNTVADPSVDLNRGAARAFDIIPLGTTITSNVPGNWIDLAADVVIDLLNGSFGGFVSVSGDILFRQGASGFGAGNLFKMQGTIKNESGSNVIIGSQYTFVNIGTYQADGAFAQANLFHRICLFQSQWNVINGATMSVTTMNGGGYINHNVGTSVTISNRRDWEWALGVNNGTQTNWDCIYVPAITGGTNFSVIRSLVNSGATRRFINHTGTAQSDFGGAIGLGSGATIDVLLSRGAANRLDLASGDSFNIVNGDFTHAGTNFGIHGSSAPQSAAYTPTNVTTDRAYDANATTLDELADVLGTLIADLQAKGFIG